MRSQTPAGTHASDSSARPGRSRSLRGALTGLLLAVFVPMLLVAGAFLWRQWDLQRGQALENLRDRARTLQLSVDRELALHQSMLSTLATSSAIDKRDWRDFHRAAREAAAVRPGSWIVLIGPGGEQIVNTSVPYGTKLPNALPPPEGEVQWRGRKIPAFDPGAFRTTLEGGPIVFTDIFFGPVAQAPVLAVNVPVVRDTTRPYTLGMGYAPQSFESLLQSHEAGPGWNALIDGNGRIIARSLNSADAVGRKALYPFDRGTAHLPREGQGEGLSLEQERVAYAYSRSVHANWAVVAAVPVAEISAPARRSLAAWLLALAFVGSIATFLAYRLWRQLALPLSVLATRAQHPDEPTGGSQRMRGIREVDTLSDALDHAARAERARLDAERERREEVDRRLSVEERALAEASRHAEELGRREEALRQANEQLVEADRRKDEFIAMLSHELRNPLAAIRSSTAVLGRLQLPDATVRRLTEMIDRQSRHLGRLVDDLLDLSRVTSGRVVLRKTRLALREVLQRAADAARPAMEARAHRFLVSLPEQGLWVDADEVRLAQVLGNLLDNAAKYTEPGGRVELSAGTAEGWAVIRVADTGVGIPAELLPQVFDPFVQGDRTLDRAEGGLGLGLALVQRLIEKHGGTVSVESGGAAGGTRFELRLPLAEGPPPAAPEAAAAAPGGPLRLLVVDDNRDAADSLALLLRLAGHQADTAYGGQQAIERVRQSAPDAVLLDIGMPGLDGYEVARRLKAGAAPCPFLVAVTGYGQLQDERAAAEAGFQRHLLKPVEPERLREVLDAVAAGRG